ncbi:orotidine-5'-phosphate decarboxylase [Williamsoniiplasma lucivorax]|uniref:Orotidine 5'-phosphate decarboxylase n=1 Tax=Williamsoniiplasma lucivorax TaxID=209274 RepID=A0A2S5RAB5_9MOLU|nr:orotidine-5'-phosphate decarboxylase [Williamsoniiplasma lucivorax]PPE04132.1 orotidine 5'-phosphate decarboxylase [Williamsoniiplasma lucivorax]
MKSKPIIALDFADEKQLNDFLKQFKNEKLFLKVGLELFTKCGPQVLIALKNQGHQLFIDLKLHDIPNTVENAVRNLVKLNPEIITVHAAGGIEMLKNLKTIVDQEGAPTKIFGVTILTSISQDVLFRQWKVNKTIKEQTLDFAEIVKTANLDGVVCSPWEVVALKQKFGQEFLCLTPGIRNKASHSDQKRVATVEQTRDFGSDYIVVGREITNSDNPYQTYLEIKKEWEKDA